MFWGVGFVDHTFEIEFFWLLVSEIYVNHVRAITIVYTNYNL
jgi:hypothetical protein